MFYSSSVCIYCRYVLGFVSRLHVTFSYQVFYPCLLLQFVVGSFCDRFNLRQLIENKLLTPFPLENRITSMIVTYHSTNEMNNLALASVLMNTRQLSPVGGRA